jgi:hypothetical protein
MHFTRILAILAASAFVSAAPAMKNASGADNMMTSGTAMDVKDMDGMMKADHMDRTMMGKDKNDMMADGMMRSSHPKRGMMGEGGMMNKDGSMGKDGMNAGDIVKDSGMAFHQEHATGMGNGMTEGMTKSRSLE